MNILDITHLSQNEKTRFGEFLISLGNYQKNDGFRLLSFNSSLVCRFQLDSFFTSDLCKMHNFFKDIGYPELSEQILNYLKDE